MTVDFFNTWRDIQIKSFQDLQHHEVILEQESVMLEFVKLFPHARWKWQAPKNNFYEICKKHINIVEQGHDSIVIYGEVISNMDTAKLCDTIKKLISDVDRAYVAVNRYLIQKNTSGIELPDSIEESLDALVGSCHGKFKRLTRFDHVDGNHMVFSHPMDCYGLCK